MKKRINPAWRIIIALLLLFALAPVVALSIPAQAGAPPDTYINNIPGYLGPSTHPGVIAGTAIADSPSTVNQVKVQITYEASGKTYYWTGAAWTTVKTTLIAPFVVGFPSLWTPQYDWWVNLPTDVDLADGEEYTVTAWSEDSPSMQQDTTPAGRSFTWDDELPGSSVIKTIGDAAAPGWTASKIDTISGTASDTNSGVACVYVQIQRLTDGMYWDGVTWQPVPIYIMAKGTTSWSVTTTTTPPLPNWTHSTGYSVEVYAVDNAGNSEAVPATQALSFAKVLTGLDGYIDTVPGYIQTTALPFISGTAHAGQGNVVKVDVKIQRQEDLYYWSDLSAAWVTSLTWNEVPGASGFPSVDWSYPAPLLDDGMEYYVWAQVTDGSGSPKASSSPVAFIADDTAPIGTQIYGSFIPGSTYLGPTVFDPMTASGVTGSSFDMTGGSNPGKLDSVKLLIERLDTGFMWDGVAWTGFYNLIDATGTNLWSITGATAPHLPLWEHMVEYRITAMGMDEAGNLETSAIASFWFIADLTGLAPPPAPTPTPTPTATPAPPVLSSITWNDVDGNGNITAGDKLTFVFSKEMDTTTLDTVAKINTRLDSTATGATDYGTTFNSSWNTAKTELTVTLGVGETIVGGETVNPSSDVKSAAGLSDATTAPGPAIPTTPVTPTPTPTPAPTPTPTVTVTPTPTLTPTPTPTPTAVPGPVLSSITWTDVDDSNVIDEGDKLIFKFDKAINTTTISAGNIETTLPTVHTYGALTAAALSWSNSDQWLTVTLGSGETIEGGETVNPSSAVTDADGNPDKTSGTGPAIPTPDEGLVWEWWYYLLIGLGVVIIIAAVILLVVLPKRGAGEELLEEEEDLYGVEEEEEF